MGTQRVKTERHLFSREEERNGDTEGGKHMTSVQEGGEERDGDTESGK
jgi:hypothetical protein